MFKCERCGSSYSPIRVASSQSCPRCRAKDRIDAPLTMRLFESARSEDEAVLANRSDAQREEAR
jgi:hypothetical protein